MNDLYEPQDHKGFWLHCGEPVSVQTSTGNWACNNPSCKYYHGAQAIFEKEYVEWYKKQKAMTKESFWS